MNHHTLVFCTLRFTGFHYWAGAPKECNFLGHIHRHEFHVKCWKKIDKSREVEFISMKDAIQNYVDGKYKNNTFEYSCEQIAEHLLEMFYLEQCEVSEDGENGALVSRMYA